MGGGEDIKLSSEGNENNPENKEGLVYAELDLVAQNLRPVVKNDDEKTEYAEIVYTQGETKAQEGEEKQTEKT